jgi:glycosyltransferase involved in cell wall biosynthesis
LSPTPPHLLYVITEDWFFCSHFLPMARAAREAGFRVGVLCRVREHGERIRAEGFELHALEAERGSFNPLAALSALAGMRRALDDLRPDIVHLIALRSILVGGMAARLAGIRRRVVAVTGLGFLGASEATQARLARGLIRAFLRLALRGRDDRYLFENRSDAVLLGLDPADRARVSIVGGAGVDPDSFRPAPLPDLPPLKVALVARMLWSKGIDLAVEAVTAARVAGTDVTLTLHGAPDPSNPKAVPPETLAEWGRRPGIRFAGPVSQAEVPAIWAAHHLALLPSRGGEGLPRSLLEAAACGRAMLTTDVPGCADFVREGRNGRVTPPGDAAALAAALAGFAADPDSLGRMGIAARETVLADHTEGVIGAAVVALYRDMLAR